MHTLVIVAAMMSCFLPVAFTAGSMIGLAPLKFAGVLMGFTP